MPEVPQRRIRPVILSGGGGTRLWPLSRASVPKQFLPIVSEDSLLQTTVKRLHEGPFLSPIIVAGEDHRYLVLDQLAAIGTEPAAILLEPSPRNTAPAIAAAALWSLAQGEDELLLVMPSDHWIQDVPSFLSAVVDAAPAATGGAIVTFGIKPSSPNTGYGYIKAAALDLGSAPLVIERFTEKPDRQTAVGFLREGGYYWNAGIFLMRPRTFMAELEKYETPVASAVTAAMRESTVEGSFIRPAAAHFLEAPSISIDYAVLERTTRAQVFPIDVGWSDVGSWEAVHEVLSRDRNGNVLRGDVLAIDVRNSLIRSDSDLTIAAVGLSNIVCVVTDDAVFIAPLDRAQESKKVVELLQENGNPRAQ